MILNRRKLLNLLASLPFIGIVTNICSGVKHQFFRINRHYPLPTALEYSQLSYSMEMQVDLLDEGWVIRHRAKCNHCGQHSEPFVLPSVENSAETDVWMNGPGPIPNNYKLENQPKFQDFKRTHRCDK